MHGFQKFIVMHSVEFGQPDKNVAIKTLFYMIKNKKRKEEEKIQEQDVRKRQKS